MTGGEAPQLPSRLVAQLGLAALSREKLGRLLLGSHRESVPLANGGTIPGVALEHGEVAAAAGPAGAPAQQKRAEDLLVADDGSELLSA
jgi:hypothetical protein